MHSTQISVSLYSAFASLYIFIVVQRIAVISIGIFFFFRIKRGGHRIFLDEVLEALQSNQHIDISDMIESDEYDLEAEVNLVSMTEEAREVLKKQNQKFFYCTGGSYQEVRNDMKHLNRTYGVVEVNHMPPNASYRNTPYDKIPYDRKPAISMFTRHHRNLPSTHSKECTNYLRESLNRSFYHAFVSEMAILWLHKLVPECMYSVTCAIKYCYSEDIEEAPEIAGRAEDEKRKLITYDEYLKLKTILEEMYNTECGDENLNRLDVWIPSDENNESYTEERDKFLQFLKNELQSHADKTVRHILKWNSKPKKTTSNSTKTARPRRQLKKQ